MRIREGNGLGRFKVEVELANNGDVVMAERGALEPAKIRRRKILAVVDSGASNLVLPEAVAKDLGLPSKGTVKVTYANGKTAKRPRVEGVYLELLGRHGVFSASLESKRETALLGAIVLEELDYLVDCKRGRVYPRDPDYVLTEAE